MDDFLTGRDPFKLLDTIKGYIHRREAEDADILWKLECLRIKLQELSVGRDAGVRVGEGKTAN
jgi:hypothetical protein